MAILAFADELDDLAASEPPRPHAARLVRPRPPMATATAADLNCVLITGLSVDLYWTDGQGRCALSAVRPERRRTIGGRSCTTGVCLVTGPAPHRAAGRGSSPRRLWRERRSAGRWRSAAGRTGRTRVRRRSRSATCRAGRATRVRAGP